MTGIDEGGFGELGQALQALVHGVGVAAGQIGATATIQEQRVARDQPSVDEEALDTGV